MKKETKKLTNRPNDASGIVWARFPCHWPPRHPPHNLKTIYSIKHKILIKKHDEKKKTHPQWPNNADRVVWAHFLVASLQGQPFCSLQAMYTIKIRF